MRAGSSAKGARSWLLKLICARRPVESCAQQRAARHQMDALFVVDMLARHIDFGEDAVEVRRVALHDLGDTEAIDEDVLAADTIDARQWNIW